MVTVKSKSDWENRYWQKQNRPWKQVGGYY